VTGAHTDKVEFGNPTSSTDYGLCLYDEVGGVPQLVMERTIPAGALWRDAASGFKYVDSSRTNSGFRTVALKAGVDGRASIAIRAQGAGLGLTSLPLHQDSHVTLQLVNGTGCWEAKYGTHLLNQAEQFKAKAD
jgi:hypothetical protein